MSGSLDDDGVDQMGEAPGPADMALPDLPPLLDDAAGGVDSHERVGGRAAVAVPRSVLRQSGESVVVGLATPCLLSEYGSPTSTGAEP